MKKIVIVLMFLGLAVLVGGAVDLEGVSLKDSTKLSAEDKTTIGLLSAQLWELKAEYSAIDAERRAAMAVYTAQLQAKQAEIDAKEAELLAAQSK